MDGSPSDHHGSLSHKRPRESLQSPTPHIHYDNNEEDKELQRALAVSMENNEEIDGRGDLKKVNDADVEQKAKKPAYLPLPEEPKSDKNLLCRVRVRLPNGHSVQRNFLHSDPVQLLWSFCSAELYEDGERPLRLSHAIPGATKSLESGLANSLISATWD